MKALGDEPAMFLYFADLYTVKDPVEERHTGNDPMFIPKFVNGKIDDLRVGKSGDWTYLLHK